jgi:SAM-dependent methyltransferase
VSDRDAPASQPQDERYEPGSAGAHYEHPHRYLAARSIVDNARVVDLASGEGYGSAWLASRAARVVALDRSADAVAHAADRYRMGNLHFLQGDIAQAPLASASADVVVCFEAIEHVEEPKDVVAEMARLAGPSGIALVSTPDRLVHTDALGIENPYHLSEMSIDELLELLRPRFESVLLLGQRSVSASLLWPLDEPESQVGVRIRVAETLASPEVAADSGLTAMYAVAVCGRADDPRIARLRRLDLFTDDDLHFTSAGEVALLEAQFAALQDQLALERSRAGRGAQRLLALQPAVERLLTELEHQQDQIARLQDRPVVLEPESPPAPPAGARGFVQRVLRRLGR